MNVCLPDRALQILDRILKAMSLACQYCAQGFYKYYTEITITLAITKLNNISNNISNLNFNISF